MEARDEGQIPDNLHEAIEHYTKKFSFLKIKIELYNSI